MACGENSPGTAVKVECHQISRGRLSILSAPLGESFATTDRHGLGDLALNGEDIGQVAIVSLRPQVRVGARVDQLRVHPHALPSAEHYLLPFATPSLLRDLAQIAS